jgi:uncharacterized glyoxalase superfamily protein PhnB
MTATPWFKVGLRVEDVEAAASFYGGLGFERVGAVPNERGDPVLVILQRGEVNLIVDALVGLPFPDTARERNIKRGPRGLGVAIGLVVDDLDAALGYCTDAACEIVSEPEETPWGDRVFSCLDPFGYEWEISVPLEDAQNENVFEVTSERWFDIGRKASRRATPRR